MGPGGPPRGFMGPQERAREKLKEPKPESIKEVPGYLWRVVSKFFHRLLYIFGIVWDTRPWILFFMVFMAVFNGITPVVGTHRGFGCTVNFGFTNQIVLI